MSHALILILLTSGAYVVACTLLLLGDWLARGRSSGSCGGCGGCQCGASRQRASGDG